MGKILKIEDAKIVEEEGVEIARYVFNDDKIVRVNNETDRVITKNVPQKYLDLISIYSTSNEIEKKTERKRSKKSTLEDKIEKIRSGKGAGMGVFLGILTQLTIIGPFIAGFCSFGFFDDITNKEYLENADAEEINFRKGFYAVAVSGVFAPLISLIVSVASCAQWKADMISVLRDEPTAQSLNKHACFKAWFWVGVVINVLYLIAVFSNINRYGRAY